MLTPITPERCTALDVRCELDPPPWVEAQKMAIFFRGRLPYAAALRELADWFGQERRARFVLDRYGDVCDSFAEVAPSPTRLCAQWVLAKRYSRVVHMSGWCNRRPALAVRNA